jgi:hypothetical protein
VKIDNTKHCDVLVSTAAFSQWVAAQNPTVPLFSSDLPEILQDDTLK